MFGGIRLGFHFRNRSTVPSNNNSEIKNSTRKCFYVRFPFFKKSIGIAVDHYSLRFISKYYVNLLSTNPTIWSNTLKQFVGNSPTNWLVELALKGLRSLLYKVCAVSFDIAMRNAVIIYCILFLELLKWNLSVSFLSTITFTTDCSEFFISFYFDLF